MKKYHLDINSPISIKKYWLYFDDIDSDTLIDSIKNIHSTDSYAEIRMIMDLYGLKVDSITICRDDSKITCVLVNLKHE